MFSGSSTSLNSDSSSYESMRRRTAKSAGIGVEGGDYRSKKGGKNAGFDAETVRTAPNVWALLGFGWAGVLEFYMAKVRTPVKPLWFVSDLRKNGHANTSVHKYRSTLDAKCVRTLDSDISGLFKGSCR